MDKVTNDSTDMPDSLRAWHKKKITIDILLESQVTFIEREPSGVSRCHNTYQLNSP